MEALSGKSSLWSAAWNRIMMLLTQAVVCYHGPCGLHISVMISSRLRRATGVLSLGI